VWILTVRVKNDVNSSKTRKQAEDFFKKVDTLEQPPLFSPTAMEFVLVHTPMLEYIYDSGDNRSQGEVLARRLVAQQ